MSKNVLLRENIQLNLPAESSGEAIRRSGRMLLESGYVKKRYIEGMIARDSQLSVAIGNAIAIPHGEADYRKDILSTGLVVLTYPQAIDWHGQNVHIVIGIAAASEEHIDILGNIVDIFDTEDDVKKFLDITSKETIHAMLCKGVS